jgi:AcrR family transcriptional regulator
MPGPQRSFDKNEVLDTLMNVFWRQGYVGTSMSDITHATGLTKPSLYAAYGNKEAMYCAALDCYLQLQSKDVYSKLVDDGRGLIESLADFLKATARGATRRNRPAGCLIAGASCDAQAELLPDEAYALISQINSMGNEMLVEFCRLHLSPRARGKFDAESLAAYVLILQSGLVQMAVRGIDYTSLERSIETAIAGLACDLTEI